MNEDKKIGETLKTFRLNKGITQEIVANEIGVGRTTYIDIEKGERPLKGTEAVALANFYEISTDMIYGGLINMIPAQATDDVYTFPIRIIGEGSCELGKNNEDYVTTETLDIPNAWISGSFNDYFIVVAKGDSMIDSHITNNSLLLFKRQETLENGQIGAFNLNGEDYIKKFKRLNSGTILLQSANSNYDDIEVTEDDEFRIVGILKKIVISL